MKRKWTSSIGDNGGPLYPYSAFLVSPTGKQEWVGDYITRGRAMAEAKAALREKNHDA